MKNNCINQLHGGVNMANTIVSISAIISAITTGVIAYYAFQSYMLSAAIKKASDEQQKNINKFTMGLITTALFIARAAHTSKTDVKIQEFDSKLKEVEKYFNQNQN